MHIGHIAFQNILHDHHKHCLSDLICYIYNYGVVALKE